MARTTANGAMRIPGAAMRPALPQASGPVMDAGLWRNPCWLAFRINQLSQLHNLPLYGTIEREHGLSRPDYVVMYSLGLQDGLTAQEVSQSFRFPKNTLSRAIHKLVAKGLVRRTPDRADKRSFILNLTPRGRALLDRTLPLFVELQERMLAALSESERQSLSVLLAKIVLDSPNWSGSAGEAASPPARRRAAA